MSTALTLVWFYKYTILKWNVPRMVIWGVREKWEMGALKFSGLKNMVNIAQADLKLLIFLP